MHLRIEEKKKHTEHNLSQAVAVIIALIGLTYRYFFLNTGGGTYFPVGLGAYPRLI